ncbi:MAG TPA: tetratricopeptide repeat protein [Kofleriaceae bacterium]|nr:tetratricopeptide repeat protein [Kofleriaceae bacterium]
MRVQLRFAWVGMVVMAQLSAVGHAQSPPVSSPAPVSPQVQAQAKAFVDQGIAAQDAGEYDVAIRYYGEAYRLVPHPDLIFNIAQAQRLAGRFDEALATYRRYLDAAPNGSRASLASQLIAQLDARNTQHASKPAPPALRVAQPEATARERARTDAQGPPSSMPVTTGVAVNESPQTPGANLRLAGLVSGAVGVVACGVAIGYGLRARSLSKELSEPNAAYSPAKVDAGHRDDHIMIAAWITGGVLVGAGGVLYYLGYQEGRHAQSLTLAPVVSGELTGLVVSGPLP